MAFSIADIFGGSVVKGISDLIGQFHLSPEDKAKMQMAVQENQAEVVKAQLAMDAKLQDAITNEVTQSAEIIKAEANSQSWLPRNVRPLLLLMWGTLITINFLVPNVAQWGHIQIIPLQLDPWVYKLTAIGYTGYAGFRTWEKLKDSN